MDRYFERIADIIDKKKISSRIRFMLQDVQEMRKVNVNLRGWLALHMVCM